MKGYEGLKHTMYALKVTTEAKNDVRSRIRSTMNGVGISPGSGHTLKAEIDYRKDDCHYGAPKSRQQ